MQGRYFKITGRSGDIGIGPVGITYNPARMTDEEAIHCLEQHGLSLLAVRTDPSMEVLCKLFQDGEYVELQYIQRCLRQEMLTEDQMTELTSPTQTAMKQMAQALVSRLDAELLQALEAAAPGCSIRDMAPDLRCVNFRGQPFSDYFLGELPLLRVWPPDVHIGAGTISATQQIQKLYTPA